MLSSVAPSWRWQRRRRRRRMEEATVVMAAVAFLGVLACSWAPGAEAQAYGEK